MQCASCHTTLAVQTTFCPVCAARISPSGDGTDSVRRTLEQAIGSQFEFIRLLGRGGMGFVYLARERGLERLVAIKVLSPEIASTPRIRERFRREARTSAKLNHPNILPLHTFGEVGELAYLVMAYVHGEALSERLARDGRLPSEDARRILIELADALDYAHRHGVIHRDIKPENVLMEDESGRAILVDFGIAKALSGTGTLTGSGMIIGTPRYMSPEQAIGDRAIDGRSDIYSLGVVGYAMLTGRPLHDGANVREVLGKIAAQGPPPLQAVLSGEPDDLVASLARCLARDPEARWPDGRSLKLALIHDDKSDAGLPDELRDIPGFGLWAAVWSIAWWIAAGKARADHGDAIIFFLIGLLVPVGFLLLAWNMGRSGYRYAHVFRVACWPPKWWGLWWPRSFRRSGDLWERLPASSRLTRVVLTAFFVVLPMLIFAGRWANESTAGWSRQITEHHVIGMTESGLVILTAVMIAANAVLWRRRGLASPDAAWLIVGPTIETRFWGRPQIASLLSRSPGLVPREADPPQTPHDYLRGIIDAAETLTGSARTLGSDAVSAARQLVGSIDALDKEIGMLSRDVDSVEIARLERRLSALGEDESDGDEQHMRMLLQSQLDLLRRLAARLEGAAADRAHRIGMLRTLALYVADLRARTAEESLESGEVTAQIRALCDAIEQHGEQRGEQQPGAPDQ